MNLFLYGVLMGLGAAIPFGPINMEITRRNLHYGTRAGIAFGLGPCLADVTYLVLLGFGALTLLQYPQILRILGVAGSLVLVWFGIKALRAKTIEGPAETHKRSFFRQIFAGYAMTLFSPYNVLFWSSITAQIALISSASGGLIKAAAGVLAGSIGWIFFLNFLLHYTRHKIPQKIVRSLNVIGGIILLAFAVFGIIKALW